MDVDEVARAAGCTVIGRLAGGEGAGAYEVVTVEGTRAVLKFDDGDILDFARAESTTDALRSRGYPAPKYLRRGRVGATQFGITELLPGTTTSDLTAELVPRIVELVDLQHDVGLPPRAPWVDMIVSSIVDGWHGFCEHESLRRYSPETRALLDRLRTIAAAFVGIDVAVGDVVHFDFHTRNMCFDGARVTGVFDWEGCTSGDAAFDLVTQALYAPEHRDRLLDAATARTDPAAVRLYAAHMTLRQVDWSIRHHDDTGIRWAIDTSVALLAAAGAG